jgi:trans-aconitate methyltransferase
MNEMAKENWESADPYELYVGRWSRKVAIEFLAWIAVPAKVTWADIGCGTGALTQSIFTSCDSASISAIDKADGFITAARQIISDIKVTFGTADATALPWEQPYVRCHCFRPGFELRAG